MTLDLKRFVDMFTNSVAYAPYVSQSYPPPPIGEVPPDMDASVDQTITPEDDNVQSTPLRRWAREINGEERIRMGLSRHRSEQHRAAYEREIEKATTLAAQATEHFTTPKDYPAVTTSVQQYDTTPYHHSSTYISQPAQEYATTAQDYGSQGGYYIAGGNINADQQQGAIDRRGIPQDSAGAVPGGAQYSSTSNAYPQADTRGGYYALAPQFQEYLSSPSQVQSASETPPASHLTHQHDHSDVPDDSTSIVERTILNLKKAKVRAGSSSKILEYLI